MAKVRNPFFSFSARGSLNKILTARHRDRGAIIEEHPYPKDAKTSNQLAWRTMYQACTDLWNSLSAAERKIWHTNARRVQQTGYSLYMSQCLRPNPGIYLPLAGGTMQGDIDMDGNNILNWSGGGGSWILIDNHVFTAQATSYTVSGLDGNTDKVYAAFIFLVRNVAAQTHILLRPNNDSGSNYRFQILFAYGNTIAASHINPYTAIPFAQVQVDSVNSFCPAQYLMATTGYYRHTHGYRHSGYGATLGHPIWCSIVGEWKNSASNITSLAFVADQANGIGPNSRIMLFKIPGV